MIRLELTLTAHKTAEHTGVAGRAEGSVHNAPVLARNRHAGRTDPDGRIAGGCRIDRTGRVDRSLAGKGIRPGSNSGSDRTDRKDRTS